MISNSHFCDRIALLLGALLAAILVATSTVRAQDQDSPLRSIAKTTGFATDVPAPPDFVLKSRPAGPSEPIPVFKTPDEPNSTVLTPAQLGRGTE